MTNLFTSEQLEKLLENGRNRDQDHAPVVKLFFPFTDCTWLISELDPEEPDFAFGLCDLGMGCPELGTLSISELEDIRIGNNIGVLNDHTFQPVHPMSVYAEAAWLNQKITEDPFVLKTAVQSLKHKQSGSSTPQPS